MTHFGPTPPPPSDGFTVPPAPHGARRIPEGIAFTVRPRWIVAITFGSLPLLMGAMVLCAAFALLGDSTRKPLFLFGAVLILLITLIPGIHMILALGTGGPLAACDDTGLWLRVRHFPTKALFLPWQDVTAIYTRRWGIQQVVCVQPRDPRAGAGMGALAELDRFTAKMISGGGLIIPTLHADTKTAEILRAFAHHSRGRCRMLPT